MGIEKREDIKVVKSRETIFIKTVLTTVETRAQKERFHPQDLAIRIANHRTVESIKFYGFSAGTIGGVIGGIAMIISGVENFNAEQVMTGVGAVTLSKYFLGSAKKANFEIGLASREINKIKHAP